MAHRSQKDGVNVQVILRCRPYSKAELARAELCRQFVQCREDGKEVNIFLNPGGGKQLERSFHFDKVFGPESGQEKLYTQAVAPIVEEVLEGFNCTIFAYGQTGTGKTYTMEGGDRDSADGNNLSDVAGVIPRAIHQIFTTLDKNDSEYTVKCSFLELYNEETTDLLAVGDRQDQKLRIMEDKTGVVIQGLEEFIVKSSVDIYALLDRGSAKRKTAETQLNKQSSRSHSVFCITVHMREIAADGEEVIKIGKLYLVDLAGSENVSRSGAAGTMAKEAGSINKSLLTLGRVITALVEGSGHIPYRDSKLTRLLRDSLGGKTKTCIIATIAPTAHCQDETLSTLDYAHRAKNIRNRPEVNQKISKTAHIKELNAEIDRLKAELFATREKNGVYLPRDQFEQREEFSKANVVRLEALEAEIEQIAAKHKSRTERLEGQISSLRQELADAVDACEKARLGIQERDFLIATHKRSESAILAQGRVLTLEVQQASAAIDGLYDRLSEYVQRDLGNSTVVTQLRQRCEARFAAIQASFAEAVQRTQRFFEGAAGEMESFLDEKDAQMASLQGRLKDVQEHAGCAAATATDATGAVKQVALEALHALQQAETGFNKNSKEALTAAEAANGTVFQSISTAHLAHEEQLRAAAVTQQEASAALLTAAHSAAAQGDAGVESIQSAAQAALGDSASALDLQMEQLRKLKSNFALSLAKEQDELMEKILLMVRTFTAGKVESLCTALAGVGEQAQTAKASMATHEQHILSAVEAARAALKDAESKATLTGQQYTSKQTEEDDALQASLAQSKTHCDMLHLQLQHNASNLTHSLDSHLSSVAAAVASGSDAVTALATQGSEKTVAAMATLKRSYDELSAASEAGHSSDKAAAAGVLALTKDASSFVSDFGSSHQVDVTALATAVQKSTSEDYVCDPHAGAMPDKATLEVPPENWCSDMCTPSAEILLAEFRRQREGLAGKQTPEDARQSTGGPAAEGRQQPLEEDMAVVSDEKVLAGSENADPNVAGDAAAAAQFKSKIPSFKEKAQQEAEPRANDRRKRQKA